MSPSLVGLESPFGSGNRDAASQPLWHEKEFGAIVAKIEGSDNQTRRGPKSRPDTDCIAALTRILCHSRMRNARFVPTRHVICLTHSKELLTMPQLSVS
jgi:hypothetical protein